MSPNEGRILARLHRQQKHFNALAEFLEAYAADLDEPQLHAAAEAAAEAAACISRAIYIRYGADDDGWAVGR